ncbi:hypothetical protein [Pseudomonas sp. CGJS7]|uniref:hypothetical protein n=1 Tax=Pseudomonas sp. CGJS7 TaxID=3109348 RepID=UPI00300A43F2
MNASGWIPAWALATALCLPACASGERAVAAGDSARKPQAADCSAASQALLKLRLTPGDTEGARSSLNFAANEQLKLGDVSRLEGDCAQRLMAFRMADLYLSEQVALRLGDDGQPRPSGDDAAGYRTLYAIDSKQAHPETIAGEFVMATRVESAAPGTQAGEFVGVWRGTSASKLYAFSRDAAGRFGAPRLLLDSTLPLRSVSYFPAPDSPSGRLGLVQQAPGEIRLISVDWFHPKPATR